jgi:hypothetical protein
MQEKTRRAQSAERSEQRPRYGTINSSLGLDDLEYFQTLLSLSESSASFHDLARHLSNAAEAADRTKKQLARTPFEEAVVDRRLAWVSLAFVSQFLKGKNINVQVLQQLQYALLSVEQGIVPAMLQPKRRDQGRKPASQEVQFVKGSLAGIAYALRWSATAPDDAAAWVARRSSGLTHRISSKPVTARMIRKWLDQYGVARTARTPAEWLDLLEPIMSISRTRTTEVLARRVSDHLNAVSPDAWGKVGFLKMVLDVCHCFVNGEQPSFEARLKELQEMTVAPILGRP